MITVEQRVTVQEDRTVRVILPPEVPLGEAELVVIVTPGTSHSESGRSIWDCFGILADSANFKEDPKEIQRRLRDEWNDRLSA